MATGEEFADALRDAVAEISASYYRVELPGGLADLKTRVLASIAAGLLDAQADGVGPGLLRFLGERAADDGG